MERKPIKFIGDDAMEIDARNVSIYKLTVARLREAIENNLILSGPGVIAEWMPSSEQLEFINEDAQFALRNGQVIDFGFWPNEMIKNASVRAGKLYSEHALGHPFRTSWIYLHSWDNQYSTENVTTAYLVKPLQNGKLGCGFEALELMPFRIGNTLTLGVGDRILMADVIPSTHDYNCAIMPFAKRFPPEMIQGSSFPAKEFSNEAAAGNVIDPLMTALMILNTKGIEQKIVPAPFKLNRARVKNGKPEIPPYRVVDSSTYVTTFQARHSRDRVALGGTHASPAPHIRIGHWRNYQSGARSWIADTMVNVDESQRKIFKATRSHYEKKD